MVEFYDPTRKRGTNDFICIYFIYTYIFTVSRSAEYKIIEHMLYTWCCPRGLEERVAGV